MSSRQRVVRALLLVTGALGLYAGSFVVWPRIGLVHRPFLRQAIADHLGVDLDEMTLEVDMLRPGPTRVGVGDRKYYVWICAESPGRGSLSGAMRIAASGVTTFHVLQFRTGEEIEADPVGIETIFPGAVAPQIRSRAAEDRCGSS